MSAKEKCRYDLLEAVEGAIDRGEWDDACEWLVEWFAVSALTSDSYVKALAKRIVDERG